MQKIHLIFLISLGVIMPLKKTLTSAPFTLPEGTQQFYETGLEKNRLSEKWGRLEKLRVKNILKTYLPNPPATIADIGGAAGVYAFSLANQGYTVTLIDPVSKNIQEAQEIEKTKENKPLKEIILGDARSLSLKDNSVDVVLLFGPLYHLDAENRSLALKEAYRVLKPGGLIFAQTLSKYCVLFNHFFDGKIKNPSAVKEIEDCLNGYFTYHEADFYSHSPEEFKEEIEKAHFTKVHLLPVEGFGKWLNIDNWENEEIRQKLLYFIEKTEKDPSLLGISSHILAIGKKPDQS